MGSSEFDVVLLSEPAWAGAGRKEDEPSSSTRPVPVNLSGQTQRKTGDSAPFKPKFHLREDHYGTSPVAGTMTDPLQAADLSDPTGSTDKDCEALVEPNISKPYDMLVMGANGVTYTIPGVQVTGMEATTDAEAAVAHNGGFQQTTVELGSASVAPAAEQTIGNLSSQSELDTALGDPTDPSTYQNAAAWSGGSVDFALQIAGLLSHHKEQLTHSTTLPPLPIPDPMDYDLSTGQQQQHGMAQSPILPIAAPLILNRVLHPSTSQQSPEVLSKQAQEQREKADDKWANETFTVPASSETGNPPASSAPYTDTTDNLPSAPSSYTPLPPAAAPIPQPSTGPATLDLPSLLMSGDVPLANADPMFLAKLAEVAASIRMPNGMRPMGAPHRPPTSHGGTGEDGLGPPTSSGMHVLDLSMHAKHASLVPGTGADALASQAWSRHSLPVGIPRGGVKRQAATPPPPDAGGSRQSKSRRQGRAGQPGTQDPHPHSSRRGDEVHHQQQHSMQSVPQQQQRRLTPPAPRSHDGRAPAQHGQHEAVHGGQQYGGTGTGAIEAAMAELGAAHSDISTYARSLHNMVSTVRADAQAEFAHLADQVGYMQDAFKQQTQNLAAQVDALRQQLLAAAQQHEAATAALAEAAQLAHRAEAHMRRSQELSNLFLPAASGAAPGQLGSLGALLQRMLEAVNSSK